MLPSIISINHSAFIRGRLNTDNMLIAFKVFHYMKLNRSGKDGHFALKIVQGMMEKLGFNQSFINVVLHCITLVTYLVLLNGVPMRTFHPT